MVMVIVMTVILNMTVITLITIRSDQINYSCWAPFTIGIGIAHNINSQVIVVVSHESLW